MDREEHLKSLLSNNKDEQTVALRLSKDKYRELEFRAYLDWNVKYGLDRKDTILRMFEMLKENGLIDLDTFEPKEIKKDEVEEPEKEEVKKIGTVPLGDEIDLDKLDD